MTYHGETADAPGQENSTYPLPDLNMRWAPSAGNFVNGSTLCIATFIPPFPGIEDPVSGSPSKPPPRPKLRIDIPIFVSDTIQAMTTKTINLFEDTDQDFMAVATNLTTPTPVCLMHLTSSTYINSTQTHSVYVNVSKTSRLITFDKSRDLEIMFGPGMPQSMATQLCAYADRMARQGATPSQTMPLTPPSKLFGKRQLESAPSSPTQDAPASADSSSARDRAAAARRKK